MNQQLPLLNLKMFNDSEENSNNNIRKESSETMHQPMEVKGINLINNNYSRFRSKQNIKQNSFEKDNICTSTVKRVSIKSNKLDNITEFKAVYNMINPNEEKIENIKVTNKLTISKTMRLDKDREIAAENQIAILKTMDEIKKKNEEMKKLLVLKESTRFFKLRKKVEKFVDSTSFVIFFMFLTVFIIFIGDIQNGWLPSTLDNSIDILQTSILSIFTLEILFTCIAKEGYINSFFFWLDVISTVSIIQDIGFIFDPLINFGNNTEIDQK